MIGEMADGARRDREKLKRRCAGAGCQGGTVGAELRPGARILDLVSGLEGVTVTPAAVRSDGAVHYQIRLASGLETLRTTADLFELPEEK